MKFFVNFLSSFRIFASFAIVGTMMCDKYLATFILFLLAALSDFFDGYLARKYNACTKLGLVLDSVADKFLIVNTYIMLCLIMQRWFIIIPIIVMIARELYVSGLREFMGTQKITLAHPKTRLAPGKIKATMQMISIIAFLGCLWISVSLGGAITNLNLFVYTLSILFNVGIFSLWFALATSIWSAAQYTVDFANQLKKIN
ncbi:MAG: CDP-alcohol phosphatidyltransferase family protein [Alphaproteobacteria bacterium]|nr:CDP-alcohol phosphatidyltransferase family protein [Alphaproteobacteria bacterium]